MHIICRICTSSRRITVLAGPTTEHVLKLETMGLNYPLVHIQTFRKSQISLLEITGQLPDRCLTSDQRGDHGDADVSNHAAVAGNESVSKCYCRPWSASFLGHGNRHTSKITKCKEERQCTNGLDILPIEKPRAFRESSATCLTTLKTTRTFTTL